MTNLSIEISPEYREKIDMLKQVIPNKEGKHIESDGELLEVLVDEFVAFIEHHAQAAHEHNHEGGCCGGHEHSHDHWEEWSCCKH